MAKESIFDITVGDRVLLSLLSPFIVLICVGALIIAWDWQPEIIATRIVRIVLVDAMATLVLVTSLVLLYAIAKPKWVQTILEQQMSKAVFYLFAFSVVLGAMFVITII